MRVDGKIQSSMKAYFQTAKSIMLGPLFLIILTLSVIILFFASPKEIATIIITWMLLVFSYLPGVLIMGMSSDLVLVSLGVIAIIICCFSLRTEKPRRLLMFGIANVTIGIYIFLMRLTPWAFLPLLLSSYPLLKYAALSKSKPENKKIGMKMQIPFIILCLTVFLILAIYLGLPGNIFSSGWSCE